MKVTLILSIILMVALFLLLWAAVGFIQDRRFFSTAPKDIQAAVTDHQERFPGQKMVGWRMAVVALLMFVLSFLYGGYDGVRNGFGFWQFFRRFLIMLYLLKAFDIIFFDWYLLCNAGLNFFPHFYPETKAVLGRHLFGYNRKTHLLHILLFPVASAALAWICTLF